MKVAKKIDVTKKEYEVLDKFLDMCNEIGLEVDEVVDLLNSISNKDSEFEWAGITYDIEYIAQGLYIVPIFFTTKA